MPKHGLLLLTAFVCVCLSLAYCAGAAWQRSPPIASGQYTFMLRFGEQPTMQGWPLDVSIDGRHITVVNPKPLAAWPAGTFAQGILMWNTKIGAWIIGHESADRMDPLAGPCSGGLLKVDLRKRIVWVC